MYTESKGDSLYAFASMPPISHNGVVLGLDDWV